jgi:hypothetical protein
VITVSVPVSLMKPLATTGPPPLLLMSLVMMNVSVPTSSGLPRPLRLP